MTKNIGKGWQNFCHLAGKTMVRVVDRKLPNSLARFFGQYLSNEYFQKVLQKYLHISTVPKEILILTIEVKDSILNRLNEKPITQMKVGKDLRI